VEQRLMFLLKYLGEICPDDQEGSSLREESDEIETYRKQVVEALRRLRNKVIAWPDAFERKRIAKRMHETFGFENCVGVIDGTQFGLAREPQCQDYLDYIRRAHPHEDEESDNNSVAASPQYSLSALIVSDDQGYIRYWLTGWPGSVREDRVFRTSKMRQRPGLYFGADQYILGDSKFENFWFLVTAYRRPSNSTAMTAHFQDHEAFNRSIEDGPRRVCKNVVAALKGRFPWLRWISKVITEERESVVDILEYIEVCIILHNMLVPTQEVDTPRHWLVDEEFSDVDEAVEDGSLSSSPPSSDDSVEDRKENIVIDEPSDERRKQLTLLHFLDIKD